MKIVMADVNEKVSEALKKSFGDIDGVTIHCGSILDVECDAVVSPANSFGFMDGGIDLEYSKYFGWDLQKKLQEIIQTKHHGELLVGMAEIVETGNE